MFFGKEARLVFRAEDAVEAEIDAVDTGQVVEDALVDAQRRGGEAGAGFHLDEAESA